MKMTILKARATLTATTLVFCLFFSDTVEALKRKDKGGDCSSPLEVCKDELYCVQEEHFIDKIGLRNGPNKRCVECLSDYDCPSSISCTNPLTPLAMCDWGAQKTFPGIDNIRKGYNGLKSDPLLYKDSIDPGWETEGFIFDYDYMKGATSFTYDDELFDVPFGHFVNVDESCSFNMKTDMISSAVEFDIEVAGRVEKGGDSGGIAIGGKAYFSNANAMSRSTSVTQATCNQYIIELDMKKLSEMKLDDHLIAFLEEQEFAETFNYKALFDKKGTHFVTKAWLGSKFGMTNTITDSNMKVAAGLEGEYSSSTKLAVGGLFSAEKKVSVKASLDVAVTVATASDTLNTFSIGSSNIASLEDWAESSKANPEIVKMEVGSMCTLLAKFKDVLILFEEPEYPYTKYKYTKFNETACNQEISTYTNVRLCYDVTVKTCSTSMGGTDSALYLSIYGEHSNKPMNIIGYYMNDKVSGNAFEQGDTDTLRICGEINVGAIKQIGVRGDRSDTWKPDWIGIDGQIFNYHCSPIDDIEVRKNPSNGLRDYKVTIQTCTASGSGTDAGIYLYLFGDSIENSINEIYLNDLISGNAFENGSSETVLLKDKPDIGTITKVGVKGSWWDIWSPLDINVEGEGTFTFSNCPNVGYNLEEATR